MKWTEFQRTLFSRGYALSRKEAQHLSREVRKALASPGVRVERMNRLKRQERLSAVYEASA